MLHFLHWCYTWTALLLANQNRVTFSCVLLLLEFESYGIEVLFWEAFFPVSSKLVFAKRVIFAFEKGYLKRDLGPDLKFSVLLGLTKVIVMNERIFHRILRIEVIKINVSQLSRLCNVRWLSWSALCILKFRKIPYSLKLDICLL